MKRLRRTSLRHEVFGDPAELSDLKLPTYGDVMRCFLKERQRVMEDLGQKYPTNREISALVAVKVINVWEKASLPCSSKKCYRQD